MSLFDDLIHVHPLGLLHDIPGGNILAKGLGEIASSTIHAPVGLYDLTKTVIEHPGKIDDILKAYGEQTWADFQHPLRHPGYTALDLLGIESLGGATAARIGSFSRIAARGGALPAEISTAEDAARLGRTAEYNRLVDPTTGAIKPVGQQLTDAILRKPPREERLLKIPQLKDEMMDTPHGLTQPGWWYSQDPLIKAAQKLSDKAYDRFAEQGQSLPPIWRLAGAPLLWRSTGSRLASASKATQIAGEKAGKAEGMELAAKYGKLDRVLHEVVRLRMQGASIDDEIAVLRRGMVDQGTNKRKQIEAQKKIDALEEARPFLVRAEHTDPETGVVRSYNELEPSKAAEVQQYYQDALKLANKREEMAQSVGVLHPDEIAGRVTGPWELATLGDLPFNVKAMKNKIADLRRLRHGEDADALEAEMNAKLSSGPQHELGFTDNAERLRFAEAAGLGRVPFKIENNILKPTFYGDMRYAMKRKFSGQKPRIPSTFTHPFTGAIMKAGGGRYNVARLMAEDYTESLRYMTWRHFRDQIIATGMPTPESIPVGKRQLIRTNQNLRHELTTSQAERMVMNPNADVDRISGQDMVGRGKLFEGIRAHSIPNMQNLSDAVMGGTNLAKRATDYMLGHPEASGKYDPIPGWVWVNKDLLGGLDKPNPLIGAYENGIASRILRKTDTIQDGIRSMVLLLRPAYIIPNLLGNVALNLIQGGFLAPWHIARSYSIWRQLPIEMRARVFAQMGEGREEAFTREMGLVRGTSQFLSRNYGKIVDRQPRALAFMHEAAAHGFDNPARLEALLTEDRFADELTRVTNIANEEMVNYERLGPGEEQLMRRLVFFYPFTKGASRYANFFLKNHPVASGATGEFGQRGEEIQQEQLGPLPPFMEGLIPLGFSSGGLPLVSNPASTTILGEPADIALSALNLGRSRQEAGRELTQKLTPFDHAMLDIISGGKASTLGAPGTQSPLQTAFGEATGGFPFMSLIHSLMGQSAAGGDLGTSVYPDPSKLRALLRFFGSGALTPREIDPMLANYRAFQAQNPR